MSRDLCPTCGLPWPNFCPQDGTRLQGPWTCPNAQDPASAGGDDPPTREVAPLRVGAKPVRDTERIETPDENLDKTILETPAIASAAAHAWLEQRRGKGETSKPTAPAPAAQIKPRATAPAPQIKPPVAAPQPKAAAPAAREKSASRDPDAVRTMLDMSALPATPAPAKGTRRSAPIPEPAPKAKKLDEGKLDQIAASTKTELSASRRAGAGGATRFDAEALPAGAIAEATARAKASKSKKRQAPATKRPAPENPGGGKRQQSPEFSETQWFMKGIEVDADLLEMVEEEEYLRDESISEEKRKKFTLRDDEEG